MSRLKHSVGPALRHGSSQVAGKCGRRVRPRRHPARYLSAASPHLNHRPAPKRRHRARASAHTSLHPPQRPRGRNSCAGPTGWHSGAPLHPRPILLTRLQAGRLACRSLRPLRQRRDPLAHCGAFRHRPVPTALAVQSPRGPCSAPHPLRHQPIGKRHRVPRRDLARRRVII